MISSADLTTDSFAGHDTRRGHTRSATAVYLWLGLPLMFLVRLVLPAAGYGGVFVVGLAHLGLLSAIVTGGRRWHAARGTALPLASLLLVLGPATFFFGAITGSPTPVDAVGYAWNTVGVAIGSLVTTAGLVALASSLWAREERGVAAIAAVAVVLATTLWLPTLGLRVAVLATGSGQAWADLEHVYAHVRSTNAPMIELVDSWRGFLLLWVYALSTLSKVLMLLACAVFAGALRRHRAIGTAAARFGTTLALALAALIVVGRPLLGVPAVRLGWAVATIPFIAYVLPYVLGAALAQARVRPDEDDVR